MEIYWGLYRIHIFFFLTPLQIFAPCLEILFFINHYFLVYIFKYRTSPCVNSGLEIQGYRFYSDKIFRNSTRNRTSETTTEEGKCVIIHEFIKRLRWPLSEIIPSYSCAPVSSHAFPGVPVHYRALSMHPNWPLLDIICQSRAILCV